MFELSIVAHSVKAEIYLAKLFIVGFVIGHELNNIAVFERIVHGLNPKFTKASSGDWIGRRHFNWNRQLVVENYREAQSQCDPQTIRIIELRERVWGYEPG